jgi:hypothetical protein
MVKEAMSMNAQPKTTASADAPGGAAPPAAPRFDRKFIEEHHLIDRYLTDKLPLKGARDLERWCRDNPQYLEELQLSLRTHSALKLLEASGKPQDLGEPGTPWWKHVYFHIGLAVVAALSLIAFMVLFTKFVLVRGELEDARAFAKHGTLLPPSTLSAMRLDPDRAPGINRSKFSVNHAAPAMIDLKINMSFTKLNDFKMTLEKEDQGRALVVEHLGKDSNGDLRVSFNSSGLSAGSYHIRIDGLPFRGDPIPMGWLILEVL